MFHLVEELRFAFRLGPSENSRGCRARPALHKALVEQLRLKAYLARERRILFKEPGICRYSDLGG